MRDLAGLATLHSWRRTLMLLVKTPLTRANTLVDPQPAPSTKPPFPSHLPILLVTGGPTASVNKLKKIHTSVARTTIIALGTWAMALLQKKGPSQERRARLLRNSDQHFIT